MTVKSCEKVEKSQVELTIEVNAAEFEAAVEKAYQKMRRKISVPGFRPGKAPRKMIERMYGAEVFFEEAINIAFPEAYEAAVSRRSCRSLAIPPSRWWARSPRTASPSRLPPLCIPRSLWASTRV